MWVKEKQGCLGRGQELANTSSDQAGPGHQGQNASLAVMAQCLEGTPISWRNGEPQRQRALGGPNGLPSRALSNLMELLSSSVGVTGSR